MQKEKKNVHFKNIIYEESLEFDNWSRLMQSHVQSFMQFEALSHHNYLRSVMMQISPLHDFNTNERPYWKKLQVHNLAS